MQADCAGFCKFDGIAKQVVQNLFDTVHVTAKLDIGTGKIVIE